MFEDSLMESGNKLKTRRGWTTAITMLAQLVAVGILILIPLIYTEALPKAALSTLLVAPPPPPPPASPVHPIKVVSELENDSLKAPSKIPKEIKILKEDSAPAPNPGLGVVGGVGTPGGVANGVLGGIVNTSATPMVREAAVKPVRVSAGVISGNLLNKVTPPYPNIAKVAHVQGAVVLQAKISKQGTIEDLRLVSGPPMLVQSAMEAVRQWKYRPYLLNGEPVEVDTQITVNFTLGGAS